MIFPTQNRRIHPLDLFHFQPHILRGNVTLVPEISRVDVMLCYIVRLNQVLAFKTTYRPARLIWYSWNPMWLSMRWLICFEMPPNVSVYVRMNLRTSLFFYYVPTFYFFSPYSSRFAKNLDLIGYHNASNYRFTMKLLSRGNKTLCITPQIKYVNI